MYDGKKISFEQFTWNCARAFGALVMLRDDARAKIPKEFKASDHYAKKVAEARAELNEATWWSPSKAEIEAKKAFDRETREYLAAVSKKNALRARYEKMLEEATRWIPPTPDHEGLKKFMVEQLQSSIEGDCYEPKKPVRMTGAEYQRAKVEEATRSVEYYRKEQVQEHKRVNERNAWIKALRESFERVAK